MPLSSNPNPSVLPVAAFLASVITSLIWGFFPTVFCLLWDFLKNLFTGLFIFNYSNNIQVCSCYKIFKQSRCISSQKQTFPSPPILFPSPGVITVISLVCTFPELSL